MASTRSAARVTHPQVDPDVEALITAMLQVVDLVRVTGKAETLPFAGRAQRIAVAMFAYAMDAANDAGCPEIVEAATARMEAAINADHAATALTRR